MMNNKNTIKYKNFFTAIIFILNIFVNLVKLENSLYIPTDYSHYSNQSEIELVVSERPEYNLSFDKLKFSPKQLTDFIFAHIDFSAIHKYWLIHYQNYVLVQLKSFSRTFIPNFSYLQKWNVWHQSSDDFGDWVIW